MRRNAPDLDRDWLEQLFDEHSRRLRAFAIRRVGVDDADDIVSEVFSTAWRRRQQVPDPATGWLFQTARHAVLHHHRSAGRRASLSLAAEAVARDAAPSVESESQLLVDAVLNELPDTEAEILRLTVWEQLTPAEIATVLGIGAGAARTRLMRARQRAQELYLAREDPPGQLQPITTALRGATS